MHSLEADKNVMMTLQSLAQVKPVCTIVNLEIRTDLTFEKGKSKPKGGVLIFTLDTGEMFGIEISNQIEAIRQYNYISYLLEQGDGKLKLQP